MIYLDNNATTLLDPEVFEAMKPFLTSLTGNASSVHRYGQQAKGKLTEAIRQCAELFHVRHDELMFTSGATEALNCLLRSIPPNSHVITSTLEHAAVLEPLKYVQGQITYLQPFPGQGSISVYQVEQALQPNTKMIVLTAANNETGIKTDYLPIAQLAKEKNIPFVLDSVALLGKGPLDLPEGVWAACFSGHKIHGPFGIGLAIVRKTHKLQPLIVGGAQQRGMRAGTENLPAIIGFAKALELLHLHGKKWIAQITDLRHQFEQELTQAIPNIIIHGQNLPRISNTSHIAFPGIDGETLLMTLDLAGLATSHGSACSSGALEPSRVLLNMGLTPSLARSSLRFSLSRFTTPAEIVTSIQIIKEAVSRLSH